MTGTGRDRLRPAVVLSVVVLVTAVTVWARTPVGAGTYYDDGVYLGLARSLAEGHGYVYANLPGAVPGVKYPPLYPALLALGWKTLGGYPSILGPLKTLNAVLSGIAAGLFLLLFSGPSRRRTLVMAAVAAFGFLAAPTLTISTVLLSEPLFLVTAGAALLLAERSSRSGSGLAVAAAAGLAAGSAFLARSIGVAVIVAVIAGIAWRRRSARSAGIAAAFSVLPGVAWLAWSFSRAADVPAAIAGQYGGYLSWLAPTASTSLAGGLLRTAGANAGVLLESVRLVWIPEAPAWAAIVVASLLGVAIVSGLRRAATRNPALPIFLVAYLLVVLAWPYAPYRFYYTILPLLTLFAADGVAAAAGRLRGELPAWGVPAGVVAGALLLLNAVQYQARAYSGRGWMITQAVPAAAYAPLTEWIRNHAASDAVVASGLDPYFYWETGRRSVPSWEFSAADYGAQESDEEASAAQLEAVIRTYAPTYAAVILGDNLPSRVLEAFADRYPDRVEKVYESSEAAHVGVIYRLTKATER